MQYYIYSQPKILQNHNHLQNTFRLNIKYKDKVKPVAFNLNYLCQSKISVSSGAYIMIQIVPVVSFKFFSIETDPGHLISLMIRSLEAVVIVNIERWVRMSEIKKTFIIKS